MPTTIALERDLKLATGATLLGLKVGKHDITEPGKFLPKAAKEAQETPVFSFPGASTEKTYTIIGLDPDAPTVSVNMLGPILHFLGTNYKADDAGALTTSTNPYANWIAPNPPISMFQEHRYILFAYEQPADAAALKKYQPESAEELGKFPRVRWDHDGFLKEVGFGPAVAANYFTSK